MELLEAINSRRSVRSYTSAQVDKATIEKLLDAAVQAPSAMNSQPWAYAVIQNAALLKEYSDRTKQLLLASLDKFPQLNKYKAAFENPDFNIFYNAHSLVIIFAKPGSPNGTVDCCLAAQNFMLAAHSQNLGTCWIGFAQRFLSLAEIKEELGVPAEYEAVAPIIVGYPEVKPPAVPKKAPEILFWK
ncbi:nitroreductase family protein [Sporomusa sphaeroides]|uniref:nitroreductase family protein n=1 Tax=Sporomusa sphaeroides TaxID=47679 RepID=UPI00203024F0|nr:nitroreductase family protein [Sporomusa sphaeroides]MCM0759981.1 nitroreductase family protein [Sporomusa sphaeroides DSM 2875]HML31703.1 nitroreductase family protein [Sporomusa sphaeroides]